MGISRCLVSYNDADGVRHSVEVDAESLYEAIGLAIVEFRQDELITDKPKLITEFSVSVQRKSVDHKILFKAVRDWAQPSTLGGPAGIAKRTRIRKMLGEG